MEGRYLRANGKAFLPVGAHWVPAVAALSWPIDWNETEIEADFAKMADLAFNTVRFDLFWAWFEPRPGDYNPEAFTQLDYLISLAHQYQIYLHPTFFVGGEVGEAYWDVPWRDGRHPHDDATMLRLQTAHVEEFARRYANESAILAWDLTDEPPFWIVDGETTDDMAANWTRLLADGLRRHDPSTPICVGTAMEDIYHGPFRPDIIVDDVDFLSIHPYPIFEPNFFPDAFLSERVTYCAAFQTALSSGAGKPAMVHELGASSAQYLPESIAAYVRVSFYSALASGSNGFIPWCFTDAAPDTFARVPYLRAPHETQFGFTTWDRDDRPSGRELRAFSQVTAQLELGNIEPVFDAALVVPYEWAKPHGDFSKLGRSDVGTIPYVSVQDGQTEEYERLNQWLIGAQLSAFVNARRAGLAVAMPREHDAWDQYPMVILPSPVTSTEWNLVHVHTTFWDRMRNYVEGGGLLYTSFCADAAIPEMESLFGAVLADHIPVRDITITVVEDFGGLKVGDTFTYSADPSSVEQWAATFELRGGTVVATDQDGRPALITNSFGAGQVLLSAIPIEHLQALTPSAFDGTGAAADTSHRIYQSLWKDRSMSPAAATDSPHVEAALHQSGQRGYVVVASHSRDPQDVTVTLDRMLAGVQLLTPQGPSSIKSNNDTFALSLDKYGCVIAAVEFA